MLFASDYDGTLFKDEIIRESDLKAIRTFRSAGHVFGIITGRPLNSIQEQIRIHRIPVDFIVGINGGVVLGPRLEAMFLSHMDRELALELAQLLPQYKIKVYGVNDGYEDIWIDTSLDLSRQDRKRMETMLSKAVSGFYLITEDIQESLLIAQHVNDLFSDKGIIAYANVHTVDIGVASISKKTGLNQIIEAFGEEKAWVAGDSFNDIPMLKAFNSFVMDNAVDEVKVFGDKEIATIGEAISLLLESEEDCLWKTEI